MASEVDIKIRHALSFGLVADVYDAARPRYADALFVHIAKRLSGPRVLEIGAGTGLATVGLAALDLELTCVEPDPAMAAVLSARAGAGLRIGVEVATFESYAAGGVFDGLISAQAWHWTERATRMDRVAALLKPGGYLGLVWNSGAYQDERIYDAIETVYDEFGLTGNERPGGEPIGTAARVAVVQNPDTWPGDELAADPRFEYLGAPTFPWSSEYSAEGLADYLSSTSHYLVMDGAVRERLLSAVTAVVRDRFGDRVTMNWSSQCYEAFRLG